MSEQTDHGHHLRNYYFYLSSFLLSFISKKVLRQKIFNRGDERRKVNLSIKILVPCCETRKVKNDPARPGEMGFSRRVSLKAASGVGGSRLKKVQKSPTEGLA